MQKSFAAEMVGNRNDKVGSITAARFLALFFRGGFFLDNFAMRSFNLLLSRSRSAREPSPAFQRCIRVRSACRPKCASQKRPVVTRPRQLFAAAHF